MCIFGYDWKTIESAQQGGRLTATLPAKRTATVQCFRCEKYFPLPDMTQDDTYPVQCTHCGYAHTYNDARIAEWPGA